MLIGSEITCVCFLDILHKVHIGGKGAPTEICPAEGGFPRTSDIKHNFVRQKVGFHGQITLPWQPCC